MRLIPVTLVLASVVAAAVAKTQLNQKHRGSRTATNATANRPTMHQSEGQKLSTISLSLSGKDMSRNLLDPKGEKRLTAYLALGNNAMKHARQLLRVGDLEAAEVECRRAMSLAPIFNGKPSYGDELPLLGDILLAQGRNYDALECYLRVVTSSKSDDPEHPRPNLNAALAYCRLSNLKMAKKYCPDQAIAKLAPKRWADWPGTSDLRSLEASLLMSHGFNLASSAQHIEALSYLGAASKLAPKNWLIADATAEQLDDLNRRDEAVSYYKLAIQYGGDKVSHRTRERAGVLRPTFLDGTPLPVVTPHPLAPETVKTPK